MKAYIKKGNAHTLMKEYQKALKTYDQALLVDPDNKEIQVAIEQCMVAIQQGEVTPESVKRNIENDPDLQAILTDPMMQQVLNDLKNNPESLRTYLKDPKIRSNLDRLIAAGIIQTR